MAAGSDRQNWPAYRSSRPKRRWDAANWWLSLLLPLGLFLLVLTLIINPGDDEAKQQTLASYTVTVSDVSTGQPIEAAVVTAGGQSVNTDQAGVAVLQAPGEPETITITRPGYFSVYGMVGPNASPNQVAGMQPAPGDAVDTSPVQEAVQPTATSQSAVTSGGMEGELSGVVTGENGEPIANAVVVASGLVAHTDAAGTFNLPFEDPSAQVHVFASGYADVWIDAQTGTSLAIPMIRQDIKALYLTGANLADQAAIDALVRIIDATEANALVVDIKEGAVYYDTSVQFFVDAGAVTPVFDPKAMVEMLHQHGIYAIARLVVFNDPIVAEYRPDLAVQDTNGGVWRGANGGAWVNPFYRELWDANIALAVEAADLGFDEIQYDYVRFPSDGDLTTAEFGDNYNEEGRVGAIVEFLKLSKEALEPLGAKLAADVFGIVAVYPEDQGIGQRLADFAPYVDYLCPMIYPSHFEDGSIGVSGAPNAYPYETVEITMYLGMQKIEGMELKMRPWLQDFTMGDPPYGPAEVRAQIDATMEYGASGWMLWNARGEVTVEALAPA